MSRPKKSIRKTKSVTKRTKNVSKSPKSIKSLKNTKKSVKPKKSVVKRSVSNESKPLSGCILQYTSKYMNRPSPSYPANECCGEIKTGNDGNQYQSRADKNGICKWIKL